MHLIRHGKNSTFESALYFYHVMRQDESKLRLEFDSRIRRRTSAEPLTLQQPRVLHTKIQETSEILFHIFLQHLPNICPASPKLNFFVLSEALGLVPTSDGSDGSGIRNVIGIARKLRSSGNQNDRGE